MGIAVIKFAQKQSELWKVRIGFYIAMIPFIAVISRIVLLLADQTFSIKEDLPLHLCRIIGLMVPFVMLYKNRFWMGVFYFWVGVGTLAANFVPDIDYGFPSIHYFLYWMGHSILVIIPFYVIFVHRVKIAFRDLVNAFWVANVLLLICWLINLGLGSNYFYAMKMPPTGGLLDFLGPYPYFIFGMQLLSLVLFLLFYLPIALTRKS